MGVGLRLHVAMGLLPRRKYGRILRPVRNRSLVTPFHEPRHDLACETSKSRPMSRRCRQHRQSFAYSIPRRPAAGSWSVPGHRAEAVSRICQVAAISPNVAVLVRTRAHRQITCFELLRVASLMRVAVLEPEDASTGLSALRRKYDKLK